jgi:membrane-bound lytic murein transglycosylase MltF
MGTATNLLAALVAATLAALLLVALAYHEIGLTAEATRSSARGAAGLLCVTVAAASLVKRRK